MAVAFVRSHTVTSEKVSDNSVALAISTATTLGNVLVARILFDNAAGAASPTVSSIAVAAGETNTWTLLGQALYPNAATAGGFANGAMYAIRTSVVWPVASYAVTLSAAVTMKATVAQEFSGALAVMRNTPGAAYSTTTTAAQPCITSGTLAQVGDLAVDFIFGSNTVTAQPSGGSLSMGAWSTPEGFGSTGGSTATNNYGMIQYKILTGTPQHISGDSVGTLTAGNGAITAVLQRYVDPALTQAGYRFYADDGAGAPTLADTYPSSNDSASNAVSALETGFGQSFLGNGGRLVRAGFYMAKAGAPTGTITAYLYAHTGTFGTTSGTATGPALATSAPIAASSLPTSKGWTYFDFDGSVALANGTPYVVGFIPSDALAAPNTVSAGVDNSSPTHAGIPAVRDSGGAWAASSATRDSIFEVYTLTSNEATSTPLAAQDTAPTVDTSAGDVNAQLRVRLQSTTSAAVDPWDDFQLQWEKNASGTWGSVAGVVPYDSPNLTDGAATTNRLTGGSGTFTAGKVSEDGLVDNLGFSGNNHTEILYSLTFKAADLANGDTLRFRILRNGATTGFTYTQVPTVSVTSGGGGGTAHPLAGTVAATSATTGTIESVPGPTGGTWVDSVTTWVDSAWDWTGAEVLPGGVDHPLAGVSAATSTTAGAISAAHPLAGVATAVSTTVGSPAATHPLTGTTTAVSDATGTIGIGGTSPTGLLWDDFNRSDRVLDAPVTGPPPSLRVGEWGIASNLLRHGPTALADSTVLWDVGVTAYTLTAVIAVKPTSGGIVVRGPSAGVADLVLLNIHNWTLHTRTATTFTQIATGTGVPLAGDTITVTVTPTQVTATCAPSGATISASTTTHASQTWVGFRSNGDTVLRFDDVKVDGVGTAYPLAGTAAAVSATTGTIETIVGSVAHPLSGTAAASSATSGTLTRLNLALAAVTVAISATSGTMVAVHPLSGTTAATSATAGTLQAQHPLAGVAAATSTTSGNPAAVHPLAGVTTAVSASSGTINLVGGPQSFPLSGSVAAVSTARIEGFYSDIYGDIYTHGLTANYALAGITPAMSATTGGLSAVHPLAGTTAAITTTTGSPAAAHPLAGVATGTSTTAGTLSAVHPLAGTTVALTTTSGTINVVGGAQSHPLSGSATAVTTTTGTIRAKFVLAGTAVAISGTSGTFDSVVAGGRPKVWTSAPPATDAINETFNGATSGNATPLGTTTATGRTGVAAAVQHSTAQTINGSSLLCSGISTGTLEWLLPGPTGKTFTRLYFRRENIPLVDNMSWCVWEDGSATTILRLSFVAASGDISVRNTSQTPVAQYPTVTGQWYRADWSVETGVGQRLRLYTGATIHSANTADAVPGTGALLAATSASAQRRFFLGQYAPTSSPGTTCYVDEVAVSLVSLPAPWSSGGWTPKPAKVWTGSAWVEKPVKKWDGSQWKAVV